MDKIIGAPFEASLRVLLLLESAGKVQFASDMLAAIDFMAVYAKDFGLSDANLHGDGDYRFSEFASRRSLVQQALKTLVLQGLLVASARDEGILFALSDSGFDYCDRLQSAYADDYRLAATSVLAFAKGKSQLQLVKMINRRALLSLQRG